MRRLWFVMVLVTACAEQVGPDIAPDEDEDPIHFPDPYEGVDQSELPTAARSSPQDPTDPDLDVCNMLPDDDSACAHACDPVALSAFIPEGTCVTFTCTLTDGSEYRTGGCNT
jgi:hypothetical protein